MSGAVFLSRCSTWVCKKLMLWAFDVQPFNAFLAGFSATVGQFVLTAGLRIQTNPENEKEFHGNVSHERYDLFGERSVHWVAKLSQSVCRFRCWKLDPTFLLRELHKLESNNLIKSTRVLH